MKFGIGVIFVLVLSFILGAMRVPLMVLPGLFLAIAVVVVIAVTENQT